MSHVRKKRHVLFLVYERNQTLPSEIKQIPKLTFMLTSCLTSSTFFKPLCPSVSLLAKMGDVTKTDLL